MAPTTKTIAPTIASMRNVVLSAAGMGLLEASSTSSRVGTRGGWRLTVVFSASSNRRRARDARCRAPRLGTPPVQR